MAIYQLLLVLFPLIFLFADAQKLPLSYGSAINMIHVPTSYRLKSSEVQWGRGSGQQSVTAVGNSEEESELSSLWRIKEPHESNKIASGIPVLCGDTIRLEHVQTQKNLHSHPIASPLSGQHEVSAFGDHGNGDESDNFIVVCTKNTVNGTLHTMEKFSLLHSGLRGFLIASKSYRFHDGNCPHCPIVGHVEVAVTNKPSSTAPTSAYWKATGGLVFRKGDADEAPKHVSSDEL
ncbi:hypothetical protein IE077_002895 [Cardiosporidium cionae]|uniref:MIR domain-containing protein n=1 Tax=Cardiosporidium cionae TaxID=476202 RepID=A0ABQ7J9N3_9APIC|nr:hypothetical protein IE077_002895 [Cardiosporidium cionae]|eukprot:KAF8820706.1 hypothetical protein IE077_002895 [Cardiosporidium cionae]